MAKRMKLISEAEFKQLSDFRKSILQKPENALVEQRREAAQLLNNKSIPDDIKVQMYSHLMRLISKQLKQILDTPILVKSVDAETSKNITQSKLPASSATTESISESERTDEANEDEMEFEDSSSNASHVSLTEHDLQFLSKLPDKCQKKAENIMLSLKEHPDLIRWNKQGEVAYLDAANFEKGSSIVDLLSYVVHDLKWTSAPKGTNRFLLCMKRLNIPMSLMRADVRKMLSKEMDHISDVKSVSDSPKQFYALKSRLKNWVSIYDEPDDDEVFKPSQPANKS